MTQPSPNAATEPVSESHLETIIDDAQKLPGVADIVALMEAIEGLIPLPPTQLEVVRYATGGNVPDADVG